MIKKYIIIKKEEYGIVNGWMELTNNVNEHDHEIVDVKVWNFTGIRE
jgi:hypothetical protein